MNRRRRVVAALGCAAGLAGVLGGCGIRSTPVPVDAGAAPSRVACSVPAPDPSGDLVGTTTARVFLVCGQQVAPVERQLRGRLLNRVVTARLLLGQLEREPDADEAAAGFASEVPVDLGVAGPAPGDPADALRLTQDPRGLPSYALGQVVCTFADTLTAQNGGVVLGGPDPRAAARRYTCDDRLRDDPDAGPTAGAPVG